MRVFEHIGDRLREERERLGFDQTGFAALSDASRRSQSEWERGKAFPNAAYLAAIAEAGADVQYIVTGQRSAAIAAELPALDVTLLQTCMEVAEEELQRMRKALPPAKLARLVALLYQISLKNRKLDKEEVRPLLKLVA